MSGRMLIISPDDRVTNKEYDGYKSLTEAVEGTIEFFHKAELPVEPLMCNGKETLEINLVCNDCFLIDNDKKFDKINAVASLISGQEIRGNVAVVIPEGDGNRGFEYKETIEDGVAEEDFCECWSAEDTFMRYINNTREQLKELHEKYDNNKSEPLYIIRTDSKPDSKKKADIERD